MEQGAAVETKVKGTEDRLEGDQIIICSHGTLTYPWLFGRHDRRVGAADPRHGLEGVADDPRRRGTGPRLDEGWVSTAGGAREAAVSSSRQGKKWYAASHPRGSSKLVRATLEEPADQCERPSRDLEDAAKKPSRVVEVSARDPRGTSNPLRKTLEGRRGQCERASSDLGDAAKNPRGSSRSVRETFEARRGQSVRPSRVVEGFASRPRGPLRVLEGVEELKVPRGAYTDVVPGGN